MIFPDLITLRRGCFGILVVYFASAFFSGCQTTASPIQAQKESRQEVQDAMTAVAGALSGKQLTKEELRNLEKQLKTDTEARSAVEVITGSVGGKSPSVKYCPVCGKRYAPHLDLCPDHHVKLKTVESSDQ